MFIRKLNHTKPLKAAELADMMKRMPAQTVIQVQDVELHDDGVRFIMPISRLPPTPPAEPEPDLPRTDIRAETERAGPPPAESSAKRKSRAARIEGADTEPDA